MSIRSARARSESRKLAMAASRHALPRGGENVAHAIVGDRVASRVRQYVPVMGRLLITRKRIPRGNLGFIADCGRRHDVRVGDGLVVHDDIVAQSPEMRECKYCGYGSFDPQLGRAVMSRKRGPKP